MRRRRRDGRVPDVAWIHRALRFAAALLALLAVVAVIGPEGLPPEWGWR